MRFMKGFGNSGLRMASRLNGFELLATWLLGFRVGPKPQTNPNKLNPQHPKTVVKEREAYWECGISSDGSLAPSSAEPCIPASGS